MTFMGKIFESYRYFVVGKVWCVTVFPQRNEKEILVKKAYHYPTVILISKGWKGNKKGDKSLVPMKICLRFMVLMPLCRKIVIQRNKDKWVLLMD